VARSRQIDGPYELIPRLDAHFAGSQERHCRKQATATRTNANGECIWPSLCRLFASTAAAFLGGRPQSSMLSGQAKGARLAMEAPSSNSGSGAGLVMPIPPEQQRDHSIGISSALTIKPCCTSDSDWLSLSSDPATFDYEDENRRNRYIGRAWSAVDFSRFIVGSRPR